MVFCEKGRFGNRLPCSSRWLFHCPYSCRSHTKNDGKIAILNKFRKTPSFEIAFADVDTVHLKKHDSTKLTKFSGCTPNSSRRRWDARAAVFQESSSCCQTTQEASSRINLSLPYVVKREI